MKYYIFIFTCMLFASCLNVKPLEFQNAENITLREVNNAEKISFNLAGYNPNNKTFNIKSVKADISVDGKSIANLQADSVIKLKRESNFVIPATIYASKEVMTNLLSAGLGMLLRGNKIPIDIKGEVVLKKFIFRKKISFQLSEKIDPASLSGFY